MAIDMTSLRRISDDTMLPPRSLFYGPPGFGKTTLTAEFPDSVFIQTEDGASRGLDIVSFGVLTDFNDVVDAVDNLISQDHAFKFATVDSLDKLEPLVFAQTCIENGWKTIEDPGYGKGYDAANQVWAWLIAKFNTLRRERGMGINYIAHSMTETFNDPTTGSYNKYDIRLHKGARGLFQDDVDNIFFINQDVTIKDEAKPGAKASAKPGIATGGGNRWVFTEGRPSFTAKNRYNLPTKFLYQLGQGYAAMAPSFPPVATADKPKAGRKAA